MKKEIVIKSAYSALKKLTPLQFDCGKICNGKCCKGDADTGMLLFPGEEKLIDKDINIIERDGAFYAICNGSCNRNYRPLSCRIFPLFPVIKNDDGKEYIEVTFDSRADCPLVNEEYKISRNFCNKVKRVGKYLLLNEETEAFYRNLSAEIEEIDQLKLLLK